MDENGQITVSQELESGTYQIKFIVTALDDEGNIVNQKEIGIGITI